LIFRGIIELNLKDPITFVLEHSVELAASRLFKSIEAANDFISSYSPGHTNGCLTTFDDTVYQ